MEDPPHQKKMRTEEICRIFYDCEASGVGCSRFKQPRIVELGAVADWAEGTALTTSSIARKSSTALPEGYFTELIANYPCSSQATEIHRITDEELKDARCFEDVWTSFVSFVHAAQTKCEAATQLSLVGHNSVSADNHWLLSELARCERSVEELVLPGKRLVFEDTYPGKKKDRDWLMSQLQMKCLKNSEIHRSLCPDFAVDSEVHTALWDAAATKDNWKRSECLRRVSRKFDLEDQLLRWRKLTKFS